MCICLYACMWLVHVGCIKLQEPEQLIDCTVSILLSFLRTQLLMVWFAPLLVVLWVCWRNAMVWTTPKRYTYVVLRERSFREREREKEEEGDA